MRQGAKVHPELDAIRDEVRRRIEARANAHNSLSSAEREVKRNSVFLHRDQLPMVGHEDLLRIALRVIAVAADEGSQTAQTALADPDGLGSLAVRTVH